MNFDKLNARDSLGFLTWKVQRLINSKLASRFAEEGVEITVEQWRALVPIYKEHGMNQGKLCELISQEKTGVSRLVAALEKRGLVRREPSENDRRVKNLYCTEAGRGLMDATLNTTWDTLNEMVEHVGPDELAICKKVLWEIILPSLDGCCLGEENKS